MAQPLPADPLQALQQLNNQVHNLQQLNNQVHNLQQAFDAAAAAAAAAPPAAPLAVAPVQVGPRFRLQFAEFDAEGRNPEVDFETWEQRVRLVCGAQGYAYNEMLIQAILALFKGRAALMIRSLGHDAAELNTLDVLLERLRQIFVSPAYRDKARSAFYSRVQQKNETLIAFHATLRSLWERAFDAADQNERILVKQFIASISNKEVMKQLLLENDEDATYQNVLEEAMRIEGTLEILQLNQERLARGGQLSTQQHLMMLPPARAPAGGGAVPMEIGNLSIQDNQRGRGRGRGRGQQRGQGRGQWRGGQSQWRGGQNGRGQSQWNGRSQNHNRGQSNYRGNSNRGSSNNRGRGGNRNNGERMDVNNTSKNSEEGCFNCGIPGHWARDCWRPPKNTGNNNRGGQRGNRGQNHRGGRHVHNVEESAHAKN